MSQIKAVLFDLDGTVADTAPDLAYAANPGVGKGPHTFLTNIGSAAGAPYAVAAQMQREALRAAERQSAAEGAT